MHLVAAHAERDLATLQAFVRRNPLGLLTTALAHPTLPTIQASHIPWVLDTPSSSSSPGTLRGHIARANPQSKAMMDALAAAGGGSDSLEHEVLVLFQEPVHSYITPKFYAETKPTTGKVVPTWDYSAVQAYGRLRVFHRKDDEAKGPFLAQQLHDLTREQERAAGHADGQQWEVSDAPESYIELLKRAIIGVEITIDRLEGRFKMSQDKKAGDIAGVVAGFKAYGTAHGDRMAKMIEERRDKVAAVAAAAQSS